MDANRLFLIDDSSRTRSNGVKLRCKQLQLDCTKFFFVDDAVRKWNKLPPSVVRCNMIISFKNKLDHHLLHQWLRYGYMTRRTVSCLTRLLLTTIPLDCVCPDNVYFRLRTNYPVWTPMVCVV